jgi:formylglycine-generating enzyme required for sulfatase activity
MHGNAWEWCRDVYEDGSGKSAVVDPVRLAGDGKHVFRGGGFDNWPGFLRSADRYSSHSPNIRTEWAGFRVVRETTNFDNRAAEGESQ